MPRLKDTVLIVRASATDDPSTNDEYNQPTRSDATIATVAALVQPKAGTELALTNQGGPVRGRYTVFMLPTDVREGDHLVKDDEVYELTFVANAGGADHHLELDAERVWP